ncbi:MAG TPA: hypothetical protein VK066_20025 [Chloroflexota bacterium]|nr:hypothetical protein [Chloroflexota bacterium]
MPHRHSVLCDPALYPAAIVDGRALLRRGGKIFGHPDAGITMHVGCAQLLGERILRVYVQAADTWRCHACGHWLTPARSN